jgi:hypothetical protein
MLEPSDIIVYIPVYNDNEALTRNLSKLERLGLKALVVDGRFKDFPQIKGSDYSGMTTKMLVDGRGHHFYALEPKREEEKLNYAMRIAHKLGYKVFMYIGADAYLEGDINEFLINLTRQYERFVVGATMLQIEAVETQPDAKWNNTSSRQPRILLNYNEMEARHLHWTMFEKGAPDDTPLAGQQIIVEGLKIIHDNTIRPKERDDMMTKYQDTNVPRERQMYKDKIAKRIFAKTKLMVYAMHQGSYPLAREMFLKDGYSHLVLIKDTVGEIHKDIFRKIEYVLQQRNNILDYCDIYTLPYKVGKNRISMDPTGEQLDSLPNYPALKALYSREGIVPTQQLLPISWTTGPVIIMGYKAVSMLDNIGDDKDLMTFCNQLNLRTECITDLPI